MYLLPSVPITHRLDTCRAARGTCFRLRPPSPLHSWARGTGSLVLNELAGSQAPPGTQRVDPQLPLHTFQDLFGRKITVHKSKLINIY